MLPLRLTLPPPHRLGRRTPSSRSLHDPPTTTSTATPRHAVVEETDSAPPASKRPRILRAPRKEPIALTHDGKPLDKFSLYLPRVLPAAITTDTSALASYTLTTTATYLQLWSLEKNVESVDVRLPEEYSSLLHTESEFLPRFLETVFEGLKQSGVKLIKKVIVPTSSFNHLTSILKTLQKYAFTIKNILIPLPSDSTLSGLSSTVVSDISKAAVAFTANTEITLVSSSLELSKILKKIKTACGKSNIRFSSLSSEETSSQGPEYLADLGKTEPQGEVVDPQSLICSLNTTTTSIISGGSGGGGQTSSGGGGGGSRYRTLEPKRILRRAFTTDCCYTEDPQISTDNTHTSKVWDLERLHERGIDGTGTTIAVLDSGINYTSPAFKDKILAIKNFIRDSIDDLDCAVDSDGHGSLCAGIAAGSSFHCPINQGDPRSPCLKVPPGVAPGAKLIICKVVSTTSGDVDTEAFLAALKWLKELHMSGTKIDVVSISLASSYFSQERAQVISELISSGVIVVCCASNVGRMKMQPISYPARLGHVLCIGAHDDNGKPTSFTPVGRELDFLAPGQDIWGPGPGTNGPFSTDCGSGTSCSTPAVAGLISLIIHDLRQRCREEEGGGVDVKIAGRPVADYVGSVWVMRELLKEMSSSPGHHSEEIGYGTLNPYRLLDCNTEEIIRIINDIVQDED